MARKVIAKKSAKRPARRTVSLDEKILALASDRYGKILKQINVGRKRIDAERRTALLIGQRILEKAMTVRTQLVQKAPLVRLKRAKTRKHRPTAN